jgi:hypothetical protein
MIIGLEKWAQKVNRFQTHINIGVHKFVSSRLLCHLEEVSLVFLLLSAMLSVVLDHPL